MKKIFIIMIISIFTIGTATFAYTKENNKLNNFSFERGIKYQDNITNNDAYNKMIDLMENRDYDTMMDFMNNITDEQYREMIDMMKNRGYEGMSKMMDSIDRQEMVNMHNYMMGR
ncbi:uncharacterized protein YxeA [Clostridium tetanomorphum]|uniref:Uncharacterized protein n=1 Tax=Clostridium tetanomorphum TaxID=1553 RepID=A0A923E5P6_CLOTT|nr:hypothetical protein [Clostridium tetanomorphum]KAJ53544.1 hypothetical protein CTM_02184 [Clostridium tetanomorphum DSM 665]MBC2396915.1 hypothetical protein [Clostridium tetanomorphum]MBP1863118.1 uncharacterized protein YxeA [Clostridium tetanomorphum]NRS84227.1 uncharacterized protein YxeA [Clostridium tetanomorphum]NRZ97440.1 uncharacterized protein YxeA [Clostridium tetanomorphum]